MVTSKEAADLAQYLTFSVAGEEYGVSILSVREILEYDTVTRVPRTPSFIRGVINLRGRVVPVVDLAARFGLPSREVTKRTCVVIVEVELEGERTVMGLVADAVSQVIELGTDDIEPSPSFGTRVDVSYLKGMGRLDKSFVLLLDIDRVLLTGDADPLAAVVASEAATLDAPSKPASPVAAVLGAVALALGLLAAPSLRADDPIQDNSFLIEEAYNQEHAVVQHINTFSRVAGTGDWVYTFTQEWPVHDEKHQLSYTLPVQELHSPVAANAGIGDLALNYRYQAFGNGSAPVAFAPRLSVLVPTGRSSESLGAGGVGIQVNLPVSWVVGSRFVTHWNAGVTHTLSARDTAGDRADANAWSLGQSVVWLAKPKVNFLLETSWIRSDSVTAPGLTATTDAAFVSPGIRWAHDFRSGLQVVPGLAFPIGVGPSHGRHAVFVYLSLEHPFGASRR